MLAHASHWDIFFLEGWLTSTPRTFCHQKPDFYPAFSTAPSRNPAHPHFGFVEANPRPQHCASLSVMRLLQGASPQGPEVESANFPPGAPGLGACVQVWVQPSACPECASGLVWARIPLPISRTKPPPMLCAHFWN